MFLLPYELKFKVNACFLKFFSFTFVKIEQYFSSSCGPAWKQSAIKTLEDEHDGNGEILYKTPTKWRWPLLKTSLLCSRKVFFSLKTFHLLSLPDRSRKSVTNELFQELCKITSILLVQIIGDPYFFHHESLTLLTIYKIWWNEKNLTLRSYLFLTFSFLVPSNSGSGCNG